MMNQGRVGDGACVGRNGGVVVAAVKISKIKNAHNSPNKVGNWQSCSQRELSHGVCIRWLDRKEKRRERRREKQTLGHPIDDTGTHRSLLPDSEMTMTVREEREASLSED